MAVQSSVSCLENPMAEEPGGLQPTPSQRVRHDWAPEHSQQLSWGKKCPFLQDLIFKRWNIRGIISVPGKRPEGNGMFKQYYWGKLSSYQAIKRVFTKVEAEVSDTNKQIQGALD